GLELPCGVSAADRARNGPGAPLIAELVEHVRERVVREAADELERGLSARAVHPHVEGTLGHEGEAAARIVELRRADATVGDDAVEGLEARLTRERPQVTELAVDENRSIAEGREPRACGAQRELVAVD